MNKRFTNYEIEDGFSWISLKTHKVILDVQRSRFNFLSHTKIGHTLRFLIGMLFGTQSPIFIGVIVL